MTEVVVVRTEIPDPARAGAWLGEEIGRRLHGSRPGAVILFASPSHSRVPLLKALDGACHPQNLVGCSTAGELTEEGPSSASAVALAIASDSLRFRTAAGRGLREDHEGAVERLVAGLPESPGALPHRTALLLSDVLPGFAEPALNVFTAKTQGRYQVIGGGAGDDDRFTRTCVFLGTEILENAIVALEFQSDRPVGIGVAHGWTPFSPPMRVTETRGLAVVRLDDVPAFDALLSVAAERGETIDRANPMPYFLHNVLGIEGPDGYRLRIPLAVDKDGALVCAAEIPQGSVVRVMRTSVRSSHEAARIAAQRARRAAGSEQAAVLFFDCAATRFRMGGDFGLSVAEISREFAGVKCAGFNTYGQFARVTGQSGAFHNCTAVVCAIPP